MSSGSGNNPNNYGDNPYGNFLGYSQYTSAGYNPYGEQENSSQQPTFQPYGYNPYSPAESQPPSSGNPYDYSSYPSAYATGPIEQTSYNAPPPPPPYSATYPSYTEQPSFFNFENANSAPTAPMSPPEYNPSAFVYSQVDPIALDASKKCIRVTIKMRGYQIRTYLINSVVTFASFIIVASLAQIALSILLPKFLKKNPIYAKYRMPFGLSGAAVCLMLGILNMASIFLTQRIGSFIVAAVDVIGCFVIYSLYCKAFSKSAQNFGGYMGLAEPSISLCFLILSAFIFCIKGFRASTPAIFKRHAAVTPTDEVISDKEKNTAEQEENGEVDLQKDEQNIESVRKE